jgi:hypothetical protein
LPSGFLLDQGWLATPRPRAEWRFVPTPITFRRNGFSGRRGRDHATFRFV